MNAWSTLTILSTNFIAGQTTVAESRNTSPITTHMLDISNGRPAVGVPVSLHRLYAGSKSSWEELSCRVTDKNGRIHDFLPSSESLRAGDYRLVFNVSDYVASTKCLQLSSEPFFPEVTVRFRVDEAPQVWLFF